MNTITRFFSAARRVAQRYRTVLITIAVMGTLLTIRTTAAHAGTDATFDDLNLLIEGWTKGSLGKSLSLIALVLGIGTAAAKHSFAALFAGVGVAAGASIGPGVINQVITATF